MTKSKQEKLVHRSFIDGDVLEDLVDQQRIQRVIRRNNGMYNLQRHQPTVAVDKPKVTYAYELNQGQPTVERLPMAAVSLSQKQLSAISKVYPNFPLDELYNLVLIDCPWTYFTDRYKPSYNVLSMKELKLLPIKHITKDNAVLLMWTTGPMKPNAIELMKHWGFTYQTSMFVWHKVRDGQSQSLHGAFSDASTEELLIATRGQVAHYLNQDVKVQQYQPAPALKHSEKPIQIMEAIEQKFNLDQMKSLEIFARKRIKPQFDLYGDELQPRFQPAIDRQNTQMQTMVESGRLQQVVPTRRGMYTMKKYQPTIKVDRPKVCNNLDLNDQQKRERTDIIMSKIVQTETLLVDEVTRKLKGIIFHYVHIFAFDKSEFGLTDLLQHTIELERDAKPFARSPYRISKVEEEFIEKEVRMLLLLNCIEDSISDWASPIVLVRKANGELRMCIDYRGLNKVTIRDQFPLPRIDQILQVVCQGKIFSKLDLKSGFWQISVYQKDRPKTSFTCHLGTFQWLRMPFGLTNAPATFQRLMTKILREFINKFVVVYIDDIIIFSQNEEEHLKHIEKVFRALEDANLRLGFDKCFFFQKEIDILGHTISNGQYKPLESRVKAITEIARPKDVKGIQMFLGLVNYHGQFIKDLAKHAKPLRELTKKDTPFIWGQPQEDAFKALKAQIATNPILFIPIHGKLMIVYTDFSEYGLGAVLSQQVADQEERVIEYASRVLRKHEKNYPPYKGEVLAVSWALQKFRPYLLQAPFRLVMDNQSAVKLLEQYKSPEKLNGLQKSVLNWVLELQEFHFTPFHRPGSTHNNADALSRLQREGIDINIFELDSMEFIPQDTAKILANLVKEPPLMEDLYTLFGLNWWGENPEDACIKCRKPYTAKNDILICDCCGKNIHQFCHQPMVKVIPEGPWYCNECVQLQKQLDTKDPTLDFEMIHYLKTGELPDDYEEVDRQALVERSQDFIYERHRLFFKQNFQIIPTITERRILMHQIHDFLGHTSPKHLFDVISGELWWPTMQSDITKFTNQCVHCAQMNPRFVSNPSMHPTDKGTKPFDVVHIDLTGDLQTHVTSNKNRYLFVLVDAFSKFVRLYPIPDGKAKTTANCMWDFVTNFGSPKIVITDKGTEFQKEFSKQCEDMRVKFLTISPRNPQANGMAERTIKTVKRVLRKFVQSPTQDVEWDEAASAVQLSINTATSQSTRYSPCEIVFGRKINYPSSVVMEPPLHPHNQDVSQAEIDAYVKSLQESFKTLHPRCLENIKKADGRNKKLYDQRHPKQQVEFKFGDYVQVQTPKVTTLGMLARGPFLFLRYLNKDKLSAELVDPTKIERKIINGRQFISGKTFRESTSNLSLTKVNRDQYDVPSEISQLLQDDTTTRHLQRNLSQLFDITGGRLIFQPSLNNFNIQCQ